MEDLMKRKKSIIWSYFTPQNDAKATCNICKASLSYRTTTSNLKKHLLKKHTSITVVDEASSETEETPAIDNNDSDNSNVAPETSPSHKELSSPLPESNLRRSTKKSETWNYFTPQNNVKATCNICNASLSYRTTISNLKKHLLKKHTSITIVSDVNSETQETYDSDNSNFATQISPPRMRSPSPLSESISRRSTRFSQGNVPKSQKMQTALPISKKETVFMHKKNEHLLKRKKSRIWDYFTPLNKIKATCNFCKVTLAYQSSTGNLKKHIQRKHAIKIPRDISPKNQETPLISYDEDLGNTSQPSTSSVSQKFQVTQSNVPKKTGFLNKKVLDDMLLQFVTNDFQPPSIVDNAVFKEFIKALNPLFILPNKKTLSNLIAEKYNEVKINTEEIIKTAKSVTITTEYWTSFNNDSFLAVSAHFINDEFQIKSIILTVDLCIDNHTNANLAKELSRIITDWNLQNKILLCISDNTTNIKKAISEELQWKHMDCLAHAINSIVQEALEMVQPLVTKISDIVSYFRRNREAKIKLDFYQEQNGKTPKKLIQSVCARWSSVYNMLQRMIDLQDEVIASLTDLGENNCPILTDQEFEIIDELIKILDPMQSTVKIMCSEKQVALSLVIIISNGLQDLYKQFLENNTFWAQSRSVLEKIANGINTRLKNMETSPTLLVTTFLDPRFKHVGFSTDSSAEKAKALVTNALTAVIEEQDEDKSTLRSREPACDSFDDQAPVSTIWSSFEKRASSFTPPGGTKRSKAETEIQRYIEEPLLDRTENPINWWKDNTHKFSYLSQLVRLKFGTVATSIPCERIFSFSKTEQLLTKRRDRLSANKIKQIMLIQQNSE